MATASTTTFLRRSISNGCSRKEASAPPTAKAPKSVAFLHCVGSRDEKVGQRHCSRVCCITGVKQAIEVRQALPETEVYSFYMDMRMFGPGYEELYKAGATGLTVSISYAAASARRAPTIDNRSPNQSRRHIDRPAAEDDGRYAGTDRRHESRCEQHGTGAAATGTSTYIRAVSSNRPDQFTGKRRPPIAAAFYLRRSDHGTEKYR